MTRKATDLKRCKDPVVFEGTVPPDWIDVNGHMNVAWYTHAFDLAMDKLWLDLHCPGKKAHKTVSSIFAAESHVRYVRELFENQPFVVTSRFLAWDAKRLHQVQQMFQARDGWLAATCEWLHLHVDLAQRKVTNWPPFTLMSIERHQSAKLEPESEPQEYAFNLAKPLGPTHRIRGE